MMRLIGLIILLLFLGCGRKKEVVYIPQPSEEKKEEVKILESKKAKKLKWVRDPFLSMEEQGLKASEELERITQPSLEAIIYNPERKLAIIEGKILTVGDRIDSKEVVEIRPDGVILGEKGKLYLLELGDVVSFRRGYILETPTREER
jgi:apolipoprotein N-acyltransferase